MPVISTTKVPITLNGSSPRVRGKPMRRRPARRRGRIIPACAGQTGKRGNPYGCGTDHPRVCGANHLLSVLVLRNSGSSPRVRGKPFVLTKLPFCTRIIPACAGQTLFSRKTRPLSPDHPRVCGANSTACRSIPARTGSSPRVRGKRLTVTVNDDGSRIIPACAGQTCTHARVLITAPDHPRVCGANSMAMALMSVHIGSSPRVRGKLTTRPYLGAGDRIIPACAGQTPTATGASPRPTDHPRVCGANVGPGFKPPRPHGSSPRVRGKLGRRRDLITHVRIIPACAGQTTEGGEIAAVSSDHPRVCGANWIHAHLTPAHAGSSPRVRGKPGQVEESATGVRIIPACAGQTHRRHHHAHTRRDHPRVCGANPSLYQYLSYDDGSSPRVRGKRFSMVVFQWLFRIIPACAGQTEPPER
ncbi:hypothetical protein BTIS_1929 [Bifidobacterium tissieri]|uniref:Uncharacterized protein n=1 Tax=Bifidobacterium tissieri TaxID=1630162 RepID=A0A261F999_9BIFI|nr:hypothetical protein BTIS_1929 [Bifidobacterium tissieri]